MIDWQKLREIDTSATSGPWRHPLIFVDRNLFVSLVDIGEAADGYVRHIDAIGFGPPFPPFADGDRWRTRMRDALNQLNAAVERTL